MGSTTARRTSLAQLAEDFLAFARQEAREGYKANDSIRIRDAAEKGWLAAVQATDLAMRARGQRPRPGPAAHGDRHVFLESIGREDLQKAYAFFADRLHGACFYEGRLPHEETMHRWLDEVEQYIEDVKAAL